MFICIGEAEIVTMFFMLPTLSYANKGKTYRKTVQLEEHFPKSVSYPLAFSPETAI